MNPEIEDWVKGHLERVDPTLWQDSDLVYVYPIKPKGSAPPDGLEFPISEYQATIYRRPAPVPTRIEYHDVTNAGWTTVPLVPILPTKTLVAKLAIAPRRPRTLTIRFFDLKGLDFNILLDGVLFQKVIGGENGNGWQAASWRVPDNEGTTILISIRNLSRDTTLPVNFISLDYAAAGP